VGFLVSTYSKEYLGYLAYIYLPLLLYPLYKFNFSYVENPISKTIAIVILSISVIVLQSLVIVGTMSGQIGNYIVKYLSPFIGLAGLWIVFLIGMFISLFVLFESSSDIIHEKFEKFKNSFFEFFKINYPTKKIKKLPQKLERAHETHEKKVVVKEVGDTAEISIEDDDFYPQEQQKQPEFLHTYEKEIEQQDVSAEPQYNTDTVEEKLPTLEEILDESSKKVEEKPKSRVLVEELEENKKLLDDIEIGEGVKVKDFKLPPTDIFYKPKKEAKTKINEAVIDQKIQDLLEKLSMFKIEGDVVRTYTGPIVTTFEFKPAPNVKVSKILNLQDDLAMALKATTIRIQAPIPGKDVVGIEVPNDETDTIYIRDLLESDLFQKTSSPLTMILGKDIVGNPFITDLKKLPHLLIAGTTGSGKSVGLNAMILSLLYKNSPDNLKLIMIDPKMLEFSIYNDIPHLLTPVITKPMEAINALSNMVSEMEKRYAMMADTRTKNIENYNEKAKKAGYEPFPYIVIIIDELADLMMTSGKEVELSIARLAQMARASGIHLVVATQRPSVDVVTGLIKANLPSRISYKVGQKVDSKIILDSMGAESLLGKGDMLFTPPGMSGLVRIHAPWSDEKEIEQVVEFLKNQREVQYDVSFLKEKAEDGFNSSSSVTSVGDLDELYEEAKMVVIQDKKSSISYLQRRLKIGYNRSATIIEQLEQTGVLSEANAKGNREILI
jgi:S-DNA-T family DNA segregation ATPase FtsK/SpoIIIE